MLISRILASKRIYSRKNERTESERVEEIGHMTMKEKGLPMVMARLQTMQLLRKSMKFSELIVKIDSLACDWLNTYVINLLLTLELDMNLKRRKVPNRRKFKSKRWGDRIDCARMIATTTTTTTHARSLSSDP